MTKGILGRKVGMTQVFTETGELIAVTVVEATPNVVLQVKTVETDGYDAVQLGYQDKRAVLSNKPEQGHASKANTTPKRYVREIRNAEGEFTQGMKSRLIHSQLVNTSTLLESRRDMASKVTLRRMANHVDQWLTDLVTTVVQVQWVLSSTVFSRVSFCLDAWETTSAQCKTLLSSTLTLKTTCCC